MEPRLLMAWKGKNDDQRIFISYFGGERRWSPQEVRDGGTSVGPALVAGAESHLLFMAWKGKGEDQRIFMEGFGNAWGNQWPLAGAETSFAPAMATIPDPNGQHAIVVVWKGGGSGEQVFATYEATRGRPVISPVRGVFTSTVPALASIFHAPVVDHGFGCGCTGCG